MDARRTRLQGLRSPDRTEHKREVARLFRKIRTTPSGKKRRGKQKMLYQEILDMGIEGKILYKEVVWDLVNTRRHEGHLSTRAASAKHQRQGAGGLDYFLDLLLQHHPSVIEQLINEGHNEIKALIRERLDSSEAQKSLARELFILAIKTNIPKRALNRGTAYLCDFFRKRTGSPKYGIVWRLLDLAGMEEPVKKNNAKQDPYKAGTQRIKLRMYLWRQR